MLAGHIHVRLEVLGRRDWAAILLLNPHGLVNMWQRYACQKEGKPAIQQEAGDGGCERKFNT